LEEQTANTCPVTLLCIGGGEEWETYLEIFMIATHLDLKPVPARWAIHLGEKTTMQNGLSTRIILIRGVILSDLALGQHQIQTDKKYHISDNRPFSDSICQPNEAIIMMAEVKKLLSKYLSPEKIQDILSCACNWCILTGDYSPLNITLGEDRKKVEFREASNYLNNS
jgi:hypothetical protein